MTLVATVLLAVVVGVTLGLLGGGGSILMVPLLVYVAGMETKEAIATSLVVVGSRDRRHRDGRLRDLQRPLPAAPRRGLT